MVSEKTQAQYKLYKMAKKKEALKRTHLSEAHRRNISNSLKMGKNSRASR